MYTAFNDRFHLKYLCQQRIALNVSDAKVVIFNVFLSLNV